MLFGIICCHVTCQSYFLAQKYSKRNGNTFYYSLVAAFSQLEKMPEKRRRSVNSTKLFIFFKTGNSYKTKIDATLKKNYLRHWHYFRMQESVYDLSFVIRLFVAYVDCNTSFAWSIARGAKENREKKMGARNSGVVPYVLHDHCINLHGCDWNGCPKIWWDT